MDPVTLAAIIAAVAGGAGGEAGREAWVSLVRLTQRQFQRRQAGGSETDRAEGSDGGPELAALARSPGERSLAQRLAEVLVAWADGDAEFRRALLAWRDQAFPERGDNRVSNVINGGHQAGPVLMGRDFNVSGGISSDGR